MLRFVTAAAVAMAALVGAGPAQALDGYRVWHQGREIPVVDLQGWAVYDGDILIGRTDEVLARSLAEGPDGTRIGGLAKTVTLGTSGGRWPRGSSGNFEMPYVIEGDPDGNASGAIAAFNQQLAGFLQAVPRTNEPDYVAFTLSATDNSGACSSSVGRVGGRQVIQGSHLCAGGTLVHEMGHAVGLWHEQEHLDRNRYITLDLSAVDPVRVFNFAQSPGQRSATPYDYASIMHYSSTSFSKVGQPSMETIPPGIGIGQRAAYSAGDLEGIRRVYGAPPQLVTVTSLPTGLTVLVDGASVVTPASYNWAIGSSHVIDAPANEQVLNGVAHIFGRWNVDRDGDLQARRTITVSAGNGTITAPSSAPAVSTYTASFVRYKEVRLTTGGNHTGVTGTVNANPPPVTLPGVAGTFYRDRQQFSLDAVPANGANFGVWAGSYFYLIYATTPYRPTFRGPVAISDTTTTAYEYRATFYDIPLLTVRAVAQDGEVLGVRASVVRGTAAATDERLPYNGTAWASGTSGTVTMATTPVSPFTTTMRFTFRDWDGDPTPTLNVTSPAAGAANKVVTANMTKEYQAFKQVIPSCAGAISLPNDPSGWYAHGSSLPVTLNAVNGWTFVGWEGSLSGTSMTPSFAVTDFPSFTARFNTVAAPLAVTAISPTTVQPSDTVTLTIDGTGFTAASEVYVSGIRQTSSFVSDTRLTAQVSAASGLPSAGLAVVTVTNRPANSGCTVSASGTTDVLGTLAADVTPQTGWWWNPAESGRGFFIEKHGSNLFMAGYFYENDGRATWFSAAGPVTGSTFSGDMIAYRAGQTLTGTYASPSTTASPGRVSLAFTAADSATMTWPGGTVALSRFQFGSGGPGLGENGWWWNASEPGRGFSIETQGNTIFMAGFMYEGSGNPIWYAAQGTVGNNSLATNWQQFANGQTLTGPYKSPVITNPNVGTLGLAFTAAKTANLTLPDGRVLPLTRFDF